MNICIVGSGYVGLTSGACFAELGNNVICVDNNEQKIRQLQNRIVPFFEPGLQELVEKNVNAGRLSFSLDLEDSVRKSEVIFISVGTPAKKNGEADLSFVKKVSRQIVNAIGKYTVIVEKSTVPVETGAFIEKTIQSLGVKKDLFDVVSNPEFLREGNAIKDFLEPDRIVIGSDSAKARKIMSALYAPLKAQVLFTSINSAELIKHASNSFLATKISFINAVSRICESTGADIEQVALGMGLDKRIGKDFLKAGIGYGGSCFPKDVSAFIKISEKKGYDFGLLKEVEKINATQIDYFVSKIKNRFPSLKGKKIAILGLSFKPDTDDTREAPSSKVVAFLLKHGATVRAFDPKAMENAKKMFPSLVFCNNAFDAVDSSDAVVFLTEWQEFKGIDLKELKNRLNRPIVFDGRNIFSPEKMHLLGFEYYSVGRKAGDKKSRH